jgi:transcriptional antiterminator NusG
MNSNWYLIKVLPGKERKITEKFNRDIELKRINNVERFICPTEKYTVSIKNKKVIREKVLYSGYLYFETKKTLNDDELKTLSLTKDVMGIGGSRIPIKLRDSDVKKILKDDFLDEHIESKINKYKINETIMVIEGPFKTFSGKIINFENDLKIDVEVMIFGRPHILTLTNQQISKI